MAVARCQGLQSNSAVGLLDHQLHQSSHSSGVLFAKPSGQTGKACVGGLKGTDDQIWLHASSRTLCSQQIPRKGLSHRLCQLPLLPFKAIVSAKDSVCTTPLCRSQALKGESVHSSISNLDEAQGIETLRGESADSVRGNLESVQSAQLAQPAQENERWLFTPNGTEPGPSNLAREEENVRNGLDESNERSASGSGREVGEKQTAAWFPVDPIWQATEHDALRDERLRQLLAPAWRVLLLSDGSVTRHLQLLSDFGSVTADCFQMEEIGEKLEGLPPGVELVPGPRVQRQVWLRTSDGQPLVYAASWWSSSEVAGYLKDLQKPIWVNLSETRAELYRDVQRLYLGHSEELESAFGVPGPFWARHYVFYHDGRPLTLIYEVFSKSLERYIGPMQPAHQAD